MCTIIRESKPVARKPHACNASYFLREADLDPGMLSFSELRSIVKAKQNNWRIAPGQQYIDQYNTDGSDAWGYKAIPAIHEICIKHDLFPED